MMDTPAQQAQPALPAQPAAPPMFGETATKKKPQSKSATPSFLGSEMIANSGANQNKSLLGQ